MSKHSGMHLAEKSKQNITNSLDASDNYICKCTRTGVLVQMHLVARRGNENKIQTMEVVEHNIIFIVWLQNKLSEKRNYFKSKLVNSWEGLPLCLNDTNWIRNVISVVNEIGFIYFLSFWYGNTFSFWRLILVNKNTFKANQFFRKDMKLTFLFNQILGNNMKKCRARFGLDQQNQWCKPCRWDSTFILHICFPIIFFTNFIFRFIVLIFINFWFLSLIYL